MEILKIGITLAVTLLVEVSLRPFGRFCSEQVSLRGVLVRGEEIGGTGLGDVPAVGFYLSRAEWLF